MVRRVPKSKFPEARTTWLLLVFPQISFFYLRFHPGCHLAFICHVCLVSSNLWHLLDLSLSFMALTLLKSTGQVFCRMSLTLCSPGIFSWLDWVCTFFGRILWKWWALLSALPRGYMLSISYMMPADLQTRVVSARILCCKFNIFPFVINKYFPFVINKYFEGDILRPSFAF